MRVDNETVKRRPGRPQAFRPEDALDQAVEMFWKYGYEGVDVDSIARAVHVTKPALYRAFGDKSMLLLKAVQRYTEVYGAPMMVAFLSEPDIRKAVTDFCQTTIVTATGETRSGCMMAAAVQGESERVLQIRVYVARALAAGADVLTERFTREIVSGNLSETKTARARGHALIDLMQGLLLRAKAGTCRDELFQDALSYVSIVLD